MVTIVTDGDFEVDATGRSIDEVVGVVKNGAETEFPAPEERKSAGDLVGAEKEMMIMMMYSIHETKYV